MAAVLGGAASVKLLVGAQPRVRDWQSRQTRCARLGKVVPIIPLPGNSTQYRLPVPVQHNDELRGARRNVKVFPLRTSSDRKESEVRQSTRRLVC
jgi:hypothetical protein